MKSLAVIATLLLLGCHSAPPEMTDAELAQMESEVMQALAARWAGFKAAFENKDYEAWTSFVTEDLWVLEPSLDVRGNDVLGFIGDFFNTDIEIVEWNIRPVETFVHGSVAYQISEKDDVVQFPDIEPIQSENYFFARWEQEDGVWKIDRFVVGEKEALPESQ